VKSLSQALDHWQPAAAPARDPVVLLAAGWAGIVGDDVARQSCPARLSDGVLTITTGSSAWSHQLSLLSETIVAAVRARIPELRVDELRFRLGKVAAPASASAPRARQRRSRAPENRPPADSLEAAFERLRDGVAATRRAKMAAGWKECSECAALVLPGEEALCTVCAGARAQRRADDAARLLFEAPWLGFAGTAALISGLSKGEYESIRSRLLTRWWETLARAQASKRLSPGNLERSIASSYVVLRSQLPPENIAPATVRNVLGDELHDFIYGTERSKTNVE
jgi:hypothetical protein